VVGRPTTVKELLEKLNRQKITDFEKNGFENFSTPFFWHTGFLRLKMFFLVLRLDF